MTGAERLVRDCYCPVPNERTSQAETVRGSLGRIRVPGRRGRVLRRVGWLLDRWLDTSFLFPVGLLFGIALAMCLVFKIYANA